MSSEPTPTTPAPAPVDLLAVLVDFQTQLTALNQAMTAQQATIDALVDEVIDLIKARDDAAAVSPGGGNAPRQQQAAAQEARTDRLEALHQQLADGVAAIRDGQAWADWLTVAGAVAHATRSTTRS